VLLALIIVILAQILIFVYLVQVDFFYNKDHVLQQNIVIKEVMQINLIIRAQYVLHNVRHVLHKIYAKAAKQIIIYKAQVV